MDFKELELLDSGDMIVTGKLMYFSPHVRSDYGKFDLNIVELQEETYNFLKENGYKVNHSPDHKERSKWGYYIKVSSKFPFKVEDSQGNEIPKEVRYGNGTVARVLLKKDPMPQAFKAKNPGQEWIFRVTKVRIYELIEYEENRSNSIFGDMTGGYVSQQVSMVEKGNEDTSIPFDFDKPIDLDKDLNDDIGDLGADVKFS